MGAIRTTDSPLPFSLGGVNDFIDLVEMGVSVTLPNGLTYTNVVISSNGYVVFQSDPDATNSDEAETILFADGRQDYTPTDLTDVAPLTLIAAFWALVDTDTGVDPVTPDADISYGGTTIGGRPAFVIQWTAVSYFQAGCSRSDAANDFQIIIWGGGSLDFECNLDRVEWDTGDLSGGGRVFCAECPCETYQTGFFAGDAGDGIVVPGQFAPALIGWRIDQDVTYTKPGSMVAGGPLLDTDLDLGAIHNSYGSDVLGRYSYPDNPPPPPLVVEDCGESFRFEACDLRTGIVRAILEPTTADWQTTLNGVGQGSLNVPTKGVRARDIWPHLTSIYMARISGGDATPENPVCEGAFIIDKFSAADTGTTMVGFRSIEDYLFHRVYRASRDYDGSATRLAAELVAYTATNGIPLTGDHEPGAVNTEREYFAWERKNIGEAITELVEAEPGIEWEVVHTKSPGGAWSSTMIFRDTVGTVRAIVLQSDVEGAGYGLDVDAADHATLVDAIGDGSEEAQLIATALDVGVYPQFDATPPFKDIKRMSTLQTQANGYLTDHREPVAIPSMTIMGTGDPDPGLLRNGDIIERVRTSFGAITYDGPARIITTSWSLREGAPVSRTYQFLSTGRASQTVLNQVIEDPCDDPSPLPPPPDPVPLAFLSYVIDPNETELPDGDGITGSDPWDDDTDTTYTSSFYENTGDLTLRPVGIVEPHTMTLLTKTTLTYRASLLSASGDIAATGSRFYTGLLVPGYGAFPFDTIAFPDSPNIDPADVAAGTIFDVTVEIDWVALLESDIAYQALIDLILAALDAGTLGVTIQGRAEDDVVVRASSVTKVYKVEFTVEGS